MRVQQKKKKKRENERFKLTCKQEPNWRKISSKTPPFKVSFNTNTLQKESYIIKTICKFLP